MIDHLKMMHGSPGIEQLLAAIVCRLLINLIGHESHGAVKPLLGNVPLAIGDIPLRS